jgi:hypothetical protein
MGSTLDASLVSRSKYRKTPLIEWRFFLRAILLSALKKEAFASFFVPASSAENHYQPRFFLYVKTYIEILAEASVLRCSFIVRSQKRIRYTEKLNYWGVVNRRCSVYKRHCHHCWHLPIHA